MSRIAELWFAGEAPLWDGMYRADGSARAAEVDSPRLSRFGLGAPFDLDVLLRELPGWVTTISTHPRGLAELPDGTGYVCCGDGALGSEGFFARLDGDKNLVWLVWLADSNPFVEVSVVGTLAVFTNNLGNMITVDLAHPDFA